MKIAIRADASIEMGGGHVMRCLTLADELAQRGATVQFICREHKGHLAKLIEDRGYAVSLLPLEYHYTAPSLPAHSQWVGASWQQDAEQCRCALNTAIDWMIVDHYGLDSNWHKKLRDQCRQIMVIDDLADRKLNCDLLLDQTADRMACDYRAQLGSAQTTFLLGSQYALLRQQFVTARLKKLSLHKPLSNGIDNLLIALGGTDPENISLQVLKLIENCGFAGNVTLIVSSQAPHIETLTKYIVNKPRVRLLSDVADMANLISTSDLVVGASGSSNWERCCLGAPSINLVLADNQSLVAAAMEKRNAARVIDTRSDNWPELFQKELIQLDCLEEREKLASQSKLICDGTGARLVSQHLVKNYVRGDKAVTLRKVEFGDARLMFQWQGHAVVRRYARDNTSPDWNTHINWLSNKLQDPHCFFFIIESDGIASGLVRLDWQHELQFEVSILVAPACQQLGLGSAALTLLRRTLPEATISANVKTENQVSQKLFMNAGYQHIDAEHFISAPSERISRMSHA